MTFSNPSGSAWVSAPYSTSVEDLYGPTPLSPDSDGGFQMKLLISKTLRAIQVLPPTNHQLCSV
jgi:hypothetical protein